MSVEAQPAFYLSFADDTGWLGCCILRAPADPPQAVITRAWELGCNPGGEVMVLNLTPEKAAVIPIEYWDILLTKEDLRGLGAIVDPDNHGLMKGTPEELQDGTAQEYDG